MWTLLFKYKKAIGYVIAIISLIGVIHSILNHYEEKGYNRAVIEIQTEANIEIQKATALAVEKAEAEFRKAAEQQKINFDAELERAKNERQVETEIREVIKYVDKIKINDECKFIGSDAIKLLNEAIDSANKSSN